MKKELAAARASFLKEDIYKIIYSIREEDSKSKRDHIKLAKLSKEFDNKILEIENFLIKVRNMEILTEDEYEERALAVDKAYKEIKSILNSR